MNTVDKVLYLREAGNTRRCHTLPHHGDYTVGKHSWDAAMLLMTLWPEGEELPRYLLEAVLLHDVAERWVGDSPSPALARWPQLGDAYKAAENEVHRSLLGFHPEDLAPAHYAWLRAIDRLELWLWCHDQRALGNYNAEDWIKAISDSLHKDPSTPGAVIGFITRFVWRRTRNSEIMG